MELKRPQKMTEKYSRNKRLMKKYWLEQLQRIPSRRAPKQLLQCQPIGRSDSGKPRKRRIDG
jgi:hypothetical protein